MSLHALSDACAIGSLALLYTPRHYRNNVTLVTVFKYLPVVSSGADTTNVPIQYTNPLMPNDL
jgi:hypothetical protein